MFNNKRLIAIIGIVLVVAFVGVGALMYFGHDTKGKLPTVKENQGTETSTPSATPTPEIDYSNIQLPSSDNEGLDNLITPEEEAAVNNEEVLAEQLAYEKEIGDAIPELTPEQIAEENKKIEDAKKEAAANPEVQEPFGEPFEIEETQPEPKKDENGYIYTKEEAIEKFAAIYKQIIADEGSPYTMALKEAMENGRSTEQEFEADLKQLLTDPYSSERLSIAFEDYRKWDTIDALILEAYQWLSMGGDDGPWTKSYTQ